MVDGFGSPDLSPAFIDALTDGRRAAARLRSRQPASSASALNVFRRMHRKIVVVDGERAFVGGINYSADHLADFGPQAKQDYAVELARADRRRRSIASCCDAIAVGAPGAGAGCAARIRPPESPAARPARPR